MEVKIKEGMQWPPTSFLRFKLQEHSAWYSGDPNILANFYHMALASQITGLPHLVDRDRFWSRQIKNDQEVGVHVPIAGDIASTSADLMFAESPIIKIAEAHEEKASDDAKKTQERLELMLDGNGFYKRLLEGAETCAAMGGVYIKLAWDQELSEWPIPVVEQADFAIPEFKFGILNKVTFWRVAKEDENATKVWWLLENYNNDGSINYELYQGTGDRLGYKVDLDSIDETKDLEDVETQVDELLCVFVPNVLPNRLNRGSYFGRSDYAGIESLMDSLDQTFTSWIRDIILAQGRIYVPSTFLEKRESGFKFNVDKMLFAPLEMDPTVEGSKITAEQFLIQAEQYQVSVLNLLERIISSAGYSPQSFGLNIEGRAESGTALTIRERKSLATKSKKEAYWDEAIKRVVKLMLALYKTELAGEVNPDLSVSAQFSDSITNDLSEISEAVLKIANASAASTETKVRMLHQDWSEDEVKAEVQRILDESNFTLTDPDDLEAQFNADEDGDEEDDE